MFENYLKDIFSKDYMGTDDDMPDRFESWLSDMQVDQLIQFADQMLIEKKVAYAEKVGSLLEEEVVEESEIATLTRENRNITVLKAQQIILDK